MWSFNLNIKLNIFIAKRIVDHPGKTRYLGKSIYVGPLCILFSINVLIKTSIALLKSF